MSDKSIYGFQLYSDIEPVKVEWMWYPYIPFGKITLIQGDPGDGKSTMVMNLIGRATTSGLLPDGTAIKPINVIYQCSEDDVADTIKPRLISAGADCRKVAFINEEISEITLDDECLRNAISHFNAKLLVIDPFQAYIGDAQLSNVTCMRRILRRLGMWASTYNCAVILIGHLNKKNSQKDLYRGLGSIDVVASARSVLQIERQEDEPAIRILHHVKSSLAPKGQDTCFTIESDSSVKWFEEKYRLNIDEYSEVKSDDVGLLNKQELAVELMKSILKDGPVESNLVMEEIENLDICKRTITIAKKIAGIRSVRKANKWYWQLEEHINE